MIMSIKELRKLSGMTQKAFAEYFNIPHRTIQNWEGGQRQCPEYLLDLMQYKLEKERKIENECKN
jgi:DNA-binding transcriptional regulator YiaG